MKRFSNGDKIIALIGVVFFLTLAVALRWQWPPAPKAFVTFRGGIHDVAFSPDGSIAVCGEYYGDTRGEYPLAFISPAGNMQLITPPRSNGILENLDFSPDGKHLFGSSQWGTWTGMIRAGQVIPQATTPAQGVGGQQGWQMRATGDLFQREDGTIVSISGGDFKRGPLTLTRWRGDDATFIEKTEIVPAQREGQTFSGHALSSDGQTAAIVWNGVRRKPKSTEMLSSGGIELWDVDKGRRLRDLEPIRPMGLGRLVFSGDGKFLAAADDTGSGFVWETSTGTLVQMLSGLRHRTLTSRGFSGSFSDQMFSETATLAFAPDNRTIFAGLNDGTLLSYNRQSGLPIAVLAQMGKPLYALNCSPDGHRLTFITRASAGSTLFALTVPPSSLAPH